MSSSSSMPRVAVILIVVVYAALGVAYFLGYVSQPDAVDAAKKGALVAGILLAAAFFMGKAGGRAKTEDTKVP